ncbi:MAG: hypothetical protein HPY53_09495 [Brevinematales bacterium]|nr:hypothetical protein [Brevinematales bacterium]
MKTIKIVFFGLIISLSGWSQMNNQNIGKYKLKCGYLTRWGMDYITIDAMDEKTVTGKIGIDWSIGPEARLPLEWEIFYSLKYTGKIIQNGNAFQFEVNIANRMKYQFTFYFLWVDRPVLTGFLKLKPVKKEYGPSMVTGAFAEKITGE